MSIVLSKSEIKDLIKRSDEYTVGALMSICPSSETNMNFESVGDSKILNEVTDFYLKKGHLTQKQIQMIRPKLLKYIDDVYQRGVEPAKIDDNWKLPKRQKTKEVEKIDDTKVKVKFPYDKDIIKEIKKINNRAFIAEDKSWTVPLTIINIEKLIELGFNLDKELQEFYKERTQEITEAEVKGLDEILKPFQKKAVSFIDAKDGRALIADDQGLGKAQPLYCKILTPNGWTTMEKIQIGDFVIGSDGKPTKVIGIFPQGLKDTYKVEFTDGSKTECCHEHLWSTKDTNRRYRKQDFTLKTTEEIINHEIRYKNGKHKWNIPIVEPVQFEKKEYNIDPYLMGVLLGDGSLCGTSIVFSNPEIDKDIAEKIRRNHIPKDCRFVYDGRKNEGSCPQHRIAGTEHQISPILNEVRKMNLNVHSGEKFIPESYKLGSVRQRQELLKGLMDTDGSVNSTGKAMFYTTSQKLAEDIIELVRSLGGIAYSNQYENDFQIPISTNFCPFYTKRKKEKWKNTINTNNGKKGRFFTKIKYIGKREQKCISVENKDGLYITDDYIVTHNTLESIAWIQHKKDAALPVVVVCPAAVKYNWKNEFIKFTDYTENDIEILSGREPYDPSCEILIINYDILYNWRKKIISKIKPKLLIGDEIHKIKTKSAKRSKAFAYIGKYTKYVIGLTGTPILNRPIEIYHPVSIIKPTIFPNEKQFKFRYCGPSNNGFGMTFNGASHTIELNQILTKEVMLRRKKEDVLKELPDKQRVIMPLEIDNRKEYSWAYDDLINYLKNIDKEKAKKAERAKTLVKINTLKQLAVKGKLSQAILWIEDFLENDKLVVFTYYKNTADELGKKFSKNSVKIVGGMTDKQREKAEKSFWNDENTNLLIGNIEAAGTGMNLQVSSNIAFLEYPWSPGLFRQCEDRCHRIGQKNAVTIWNLIAQSTIEANIVHKLEEKAKVISEVIDGDETEGGGIFNELIDQIYQEI
jgi:hypothetical protein